MKTVKSILFLVAFFVFSTSVFSQHPVAKLAEEFPTSFIKYR